MRIRALGELNDTRIWRVVYNVSNQHLKNAVDKIETCGT